ncbi:uncharacterized protein LOC125948045 [Anopheles darlingi]|uniref:uncharacterized protein LOC125948045 n=1 Tax=Anopheles darlingi TaxID=43151 RepID=UPI0021000FB7|nr:uncharacterized protein LOC125948045 [Anopheles darlingi]
MVMVNNPSQQNTQLDAQLLLELGRYFKFLTLSGTNQLHLNRASISWCRERGISSLQSHVTTIAPRSSAMCLCCGNREGYDIDDANFGKSYKESFSTSQTAEVGSAPVVIVSQPTNGATVPASDSTQDAR